MTQIDGGTRLNMKEGLITTDKPLPAATEKSLPSFLGMDRVDLAQVVDGLGEPAFRVQQLFGWIYKKGANNFSQMTNLSAPLRERLQAQYSLARPVIVTHQKSLDGTRKWLVRFKDGNEAEVVFIPDDERGTLCVSSQVGCTLTCGFCHTGTQRMVRNLTSGEILGQVMLARDELGAWVGPTEPRILTNVVFMGMGEPLYNTDNVIKAIKLLTDGEGISLSKRRVTLSTSGVVPDIKRIGLETGVRLAISLHAVNDDLRNKLVPINKKYPLEKLMDACRNYPGLSNPNRITWEYVMLAGVNDSPQDARALLRLISGIPSKINLIPFNPWPGAPYQCSSKKSIDDFASIIWNAGYSSPVRTPRGQDILAACGQLKSESERVRKKDRVQSLE